MRPKMMLKWQDEKEPRQISRDDAARTIRKNRNARPELRIRVQRKYGETYITSEFLGVGCCIFRAS